MREARPKPRLFVKKEGELHLTGQAVSELMGAVFEKGIPMCFTARGMSMFPYIREGDRITVSPLKSHKIGIGRIVAYTHPVTKQFAVHRIIKRQGDFYLIKGDNNLSMDGLIPRSNIQGYVIRLERGRKKISLGLGPERIILALINHRRFLASLLFRLQRFVFHPFSIRSKR